jgi:hypothetical protein
LTAERRLAAVEAALTPTELVVAWLEEAHGFGSLENAVRSLLAEPNPLPALDRLARAAADGAKTRAKGKPVAERNEAINAAIGETVFRFRLILRIISVTCDLLDRQLLLEGLFGARLGLLVTTGRPSPERDLRYPADLVQLRDLIVGRVDELLAAGEARATVERRYLAGHPALFPDRQAEWAERLLDTQRLGAMAIGFTDKEGVAPPTPPAPEATTARVERLTADLVEPARVEALENLGQGRRAFGIASSWVRGRLGQLEPFSPTSQDGDDHTRLPPAPTP